MENIVVEISDESSLTIAKKAQKQDITLNQLCNNIIRAEMEKEESNKFAIYQNNLLARAREETGKDIFLESYDYMAWLTRKLYDNDVPVKP